MSTATTATHSHFHFHNQRQRRRDMGTTLESPSCGSGHTGGISGRWLQFLRRIQNFRMTPSKLSKLCDATEPLVATSRPMKPVPTDKQIEPQFPPYVSLTTFMKYMGIWNSHIFPICNSNFTYFKDKWYHFHLFLNKHCLISHFPVLLTS